MPNYIAVHTPPVTEESLNNIDKALNIEGYTCYCCHFDEENNIYVCDWEAPSKEKLEEVLRQLSLSYCAVY